MIHELCKLYSIRTLCRVLDVASSSFYSWRRRPQSRRQKENTELLVMVRTSHKESRETYGSPRIHQDLLDLGCRVGKHRIARLMREHSIRAKTKRKFRVTTNSRHQSPVADNLLDRQFTCDAPNKRWAADMTYIWTLEGWLYLGVILDLFNRKIVGWATSSRIDEALVNRVFDAAVRSRRPSPGLLHHSDRGSQYAAGDFQDRLGRGGFLCSMSRKGNCWDNAVVESFFATLKTELIGGRVFATREEANREIFEYIEVWYNRKRRHSALGYLSPERFETAHAATLVA